MKRTARGLRAWLQRCVWGSIGGRIISVFLGLLLVVQVASFTAIRESLTRHTYGVLPDKLQVGDRVLQSLLDQRAQRLIEGARLLTTDDAFRDAVTSGNAERIASLLSNHGARIGASEAALLSIGFQVRAATGIREPNILPLLAQMAAPAANNGHASAITLLSGRPHQVVLVPVRAPWLSGWMLMGFPLDAQLASDMQSLAALDVTLLSRARGDTGWSVTLSSMPRALAQSLAKQPWSRAATAGMASVPLAGEAFGVHAKWLTPPTLATDDNDVLALVALSIDKAVQLPADLQLMLLATTLLGFAVFLLGSVFTARRVTTPLRNLSAAAERLGAGDYSTPMGGVRRHDEIGDLAHAFEQMRISVADQQQQILKLAYWDTLTGLPNRMQFRDAARDAIAAAGTNGAVSVIMLDLDRFKHVNDVLGYRFGDLVLTSVAERLSQQSVRGGDLVARLGGDEFAVLLRNADAELARTVAQRIERAFDAPLTLEDHTVDMGAGIGIACWPQHANDADVLLNRAEVAMYAAKRRTSGALTYDASIDAASSQTLSLLSELRQAVGEGQLRLYLQPKLALDSAIVVGAEALMRWQHPQRGLVPPMEFIPFAEQTGFIRTLTLWAFEEAARHWRMLHAQRMRITLSLNLSTRDLLDQDLPQKFDALLLKHRVPAEGFCLEITESAIMDDPQRAHATLEALSALGFKLSIDDFGSGYSSLAYLKRLSVDELKIDKSFVMSMGRDADDAKIVRSTIDLAHNLGLRVVAEGVENAHAWDMLRDLSCDEAQGFHMAKPMPVVEFVRWCSHWSATHAGATARALGDDSAQVLH